MLKRSSVQKVGRSYDARRALVRSLVIELFKHGAIETSRARAKLLRRIVDRILNKAWRKELSSLRSIIAFLGGDRKLTKLINSASKKTTLANSGFTRIVPLGKRRGDASERVKIELIQEEGMQEKTKNE